MRKTICFALTLSLLTGCGFFQPIEQKLVSPKEDVREKALRKLSRMSLEDQSDLVKPLVKHFKDPDSRVVNRTMEALIIIGRPAVDDLRILMKDLDIYVRISVIATLGQMGPVAENSVPDLVVALKDPHPLIREEAARSLGEMGQIAEPAGNALIDTLKDPEENVKISANEALKKIGVFVPTKTSKKLT